VLSQEINRVMHNQLE